MSFLEDVRKMAVKFYKGKALSFSEGEDVAFIRNNYPFAKALVLLDSYSAEWYKLFLAELPSSIIVIRMSGDNVDPLFSLSDEISLVIVCGSTETVYAARYFSTVRKLCCIYYPFGPYVCGVSKEYTTVRLSGETVAVKTDIPSVLFVGEKGNSKRADTLKKQAYARTFFARLLLFEINYQFAFFSKQTDKEIVELLKLISAAAEEKPLAELTIKELTYIQLCLDEAIEKLPFQSEVILYDKLLKEGGITLLHAAVAAEKLTALYEVFFQSGVQRKYFTTAYLKRIREAAQLFKVSEEKLSARLRILSVEESALLGSLFQEKRRSFIPLTRELKRRFAYYADNLGESIPQENQKANEVLKYLPEMCKTYGITTTMRDFGLLEL